MIKMLFSILSCALIFSPIGCSNDSTPSSVSSYINNKRPSHKTRIFDYANLIKYKNSLDSHLETLFKLGNIDMVVVTFENLQGNDIDETAEELLSNWRIGENTNGLKGILFLLSVEEELVRFEIGYDLEWIYPDSFVGYIERDQMAPFFNAGRVQDALSAE